MKSLIDAHNRLLAVILLGGSAIPAGCNLTDDEPENPGFGTTGQAGQAECLEKAVELQSQCMPPEQFVAIWEEGDVNMLLVDDPAVGVGIGPGGWLVQVSSSADYVGSYQFQGDSCSVGCGWCQPGESLCYSGLDEAGVPQCLLCIPSAVDDPGVQCAAALSACGGDVPAADTTDGDSADVDGDGDGDGDGGGGADTTGGDDAGVLDYDCADWDPSGAVTRDARGNAIVDGALVEELAAHFGDPLADCDDTAFYRQSDGYFAVSRRSQKGVLAQIGIEPGDVILALDGVAMDDLDQIAKATVDLFLGHRITSGFSLTIARGRTKLVRQILVR